MSKTLHRLRRRLFIVAIIAPIVSLAPSHLYAITITLVNGGGRAPANAVGRGNLIGVLNAAKSMWENKITDTHTVTLTYSWAPLPLGTPAQETTTAQSGTPNRATAGTLQVDNDGTTLWFMDNTPLVNEEWSTFTESFYNFAAPRTFNAAINAGRVYSAPTPTGMAAGRIDLLTSVLHEMGHALGLDAGNRSYQRETWPDNLINITTPPYVNAAIATNNFGICRTFPITCPPPFINNAHLPRGTFPNALLEPFTQRGRRELIDDVSLLANLQLSRFADLNDLQKTFLGTNQRANQPLGGNWSQNDHWGGRLKLKFPRNSEP